MPKYLLDTSSIRALKLSDLERCSKTTTFLASPFAFWELATHLADSGQFYRIKQNLMKFSHLSLLNEPTDDAEKRIGLIRLSGGADDVGASGIIRAALKVLSESHTLEEFYRCRIRDENGNLREIEGCVERIQNMLGEAEKNFSDFIGEVKDLLASRKVVLVGHDDYHRGTLELIDGFWFQVKKRTDGSDASYLKVIRQSYFYYSYVMHRALEYVKNGREKPDPNDLEDAKLLLHLSLDDDIIVVTSDNGLATAVNRGLDTLKSVGLEWCSTRVSICSTGDFMNQFICRA